MVYIDVWQREVSAVEDPDLADPALEGAHTTTRLQTVWQVKLREGSSASARHPPTEGCKFMPSASRLSTASGGYRGAENQLYRVEVHGAGKAGTATFKWSRENASIIARVVHFTDLSHIVFEAVGSPVSDFSGGDLIEITDNARELAGLPGELRRIRAIDAASKVFTLDAPVSLGLFPADQNGVPDVARHTRLRRWQGAGTIEDPSTRIDLENGIDVHFDVDPADACFRTGDYWLIPAHAASRSIEPLDGAPPRGIHHHIAKLALFAPPQGLRDLRAQKGEKYNDDG